MWPSDCWVTAYVALEQKSLETPVLNKGGQSTVQMITREETYLQQKIRMHPQMTPTSVMEIKAATKLLLYLRNTSALVTFGFGIRDVEEEEVVSSFGKLADAVEEAVAGWEVAEALVRRIVDEVTTTVLEHCKNVVVPLKQSQTASAVEEHLLAKRYCRAL